MKFLPVIRMEFRKCQSQNFVVNNRSNSSLKFIPYIGCKAGFGNIFDSILPDEFDYPIYDIFGGGGAFSFYASNKYGFAKVTYNDNNPVVVNLIRQLQQDPKQLWSLYNEHYVKSSAEYYYYVRDLDLEQDIQGAANFLYLAKNAFSGKIRFNSRNRFNSPIRKGSKCPKVSLEALIKLSGLIQELTITCEDYKSFSKVTQSLIYLDPPYFNNINGHYNDVLNLEAFNQFLRIIETSNRVILSEQNDPAIFALSKKYSVYSITLNRSLQYYNQNKSEEIIAFNY